MTQADERRKEAEEKQMSGENIEEDDEEEDEGHWERESDIGVSFQSDICHICRAQKADWKSF